MQAECFVPLPPQLTDAGFALDDERLDAEILESRGELEPRLATPNDNHGRLLIRPHALALLMPLFRPRSMLRFLFSERTGKLREAVQILEVRENRVGLPIPIWRRDQADDARACSHRGREREKCLDPRDVRVGSLQ